MGPSLEPGILQLLRSATVVYSSSGSISSSGTGSNGTSSSRSTNSDE